jgi:hypothetical protein
MLHLSDVVPGYCGEVAYREAVADVFNITVHIITLHLYLWAQGVIMPVRDVRFEMAYSIAYTTIRLSFNALDSEVTALYIPGPWFQYQILTDGSL